MLRGGISCLKRLPFPVTTVPPAAAVAAFPNTNEHLWILKPIMETEAVKELWWKGHSGVEVVAPGVVKATLPQQQRTPLVGSRDFLTLVEMGSSFALQCLPHITTFSTAYHQLDPRNEKQNLTIEMTLSLEVCEELAEFIVLALHSARVGIDLGIVWSLSVNVPLSEYQHQQEENEKRKRLHKREGEGKHLPQQTLLQRAAAHLRNDLLRCIGTQDSLLLEVGRVFCDSPGSVLVQVLLTRSNQERVTNSRGGGGSERESLVNSGAFWELFVSVAPLIQHPALGYLWPVPFSNGLLPFLEAKVRLRHEQQQLQLQQQLRQSQLKFHHFFPSQAYLKLEEHFHLLGKFPTPKDSVVDFGGFPGGWATLLTHCASILSVDNAAQEIVTFLTLFQGRSDEEVTTERLREYYLQRVRVEEARTGRALPWAFRKWLALLELHRSQRHHWVCADVRELAPEVLVTSPVDWLVADLSLTFEKSLPILLRWVYPTVWCKQVIWTVKLPPVHWEIPATEVIAKVYEILDEYRDKGFRWRIRHTSMQSGEFVIYGGRTDLWWRDTKGLMTD